MTSDAGDYIGAGRNYYYQPGVGVYNPTASSGNANGIIDTVSFIFTTSDENWSIQFSTRKIGTGIVPGFYNNAIRYPFETTTPGLSISGNGRGCNQLSGNFTVHDADFDTTVTPVRINRFAATFEQHCEGFSPAFYGTIYYNYTPSGPSYSVSGQLIDNAGAALGNRTISLYGSQTKTTLTDANGNYQFGSLLSGGNFRVVPTDSSLVFTPTNRLLKRVLSDQASVNFTGVPLYSIGGQVVNGSGNPISGVTVRLTGSQTVTAITDQNGMYNFPNLLANGNYTVTPSRTFYSFTPASRTFDTLPGNQISNFVGGLAQFSISGRVLNNAGVGVSGIRVDLTGGQNVSVFTDNNGIYSFESVNAGSDYQIRPVSAAYTFNPSIQYIYSLDRHYGGIFFTASVPTTFSISGFILDNDGNGLNGVTVQLSGSASGSATTDASGFYHFNSLIAGNSFIITPQKDGYAIRPRNRTISSLNANTFANFVGNRIETLSDFDGDRKTDLSVFRPGLGQWWFHRSNDGGSTAVTFGTSTDTIVPSDYTGDGKTDVAFWRPSTGFWYVLRSEDNSFYAFPFGANGDTPVPADYDADGKADAAVFRGSDTTWYIQRSGDGGTTIQQFGVSGDVPVNADYDGDGKADIAIYRPSLGQWWLMRSSAGTVAYQFGSPTDKTVVGDYTGDGKADVAFWRPSSGEWFVLRSEDNSFFGFPFGVSTDTPVPGDYDGDGRNDAGVFRSSNNTWYIQRSTAGTLIQQFGTTGDLPLPNAYVR
ncbi:MAG: carboxypeptidase regulatory-like domain-containing protein [Blastocatellia bacterium]|nr:carboxypeptidase regulatory-like domain-containing protein [Blastocatellia bacterium]